jgi:hypothetical protein
MTTIAFRARRPQPVPGLVGAIFKRGLVRCVGDRGAALTQRGDTLMKRTFRVGDHVVWNSEAGRVSGTIIKVHTRDVDYKGYTHHASKDEPQYEIQSDKTDHIAMHKGAALRRMDD